MNVALIIMMILHGFYGFVLAQLDYATSDEHHVLRYAGWLILWPVILLLLALDRGAYFQD